jgi:multidrug resistance efflux pump
MRTGVAAIPCRSIKTLSRRLPFRKNSFEAAPTNCVLEVLSVKVGDKLAPNQNIGTLLLTNHLWVRVYVPEPWLGHIQLGEPVTVRVDFCPGWGFPGVVE